MMNWLKKPMPLILVDLLVNKLAEIEGKIPSITGSTTTAALATVENKTTNVTNLVKNTRLR